MGLACGGGQQGPIFAAHGYETTIMDFSLKQLEKDRFVAERENLDLQTIQADMTQLFLLRMKLLTLFFALFQMSILKT